MLRTKINSFSIENSSFLPNFRQKLPAKSHTVLGGLYIFVCLIHRNRSKKKNEMINLAEFISLLNFIPFLWIWFIHIILFTSLRRSVNVINTSMMNSFLQKMKHKIGLNNHKMLRLAQITGYHFMMITSSKWINKSRQIYFNMYGIYILKIDMPSKIIW